MDEFKRDLLKEHWWILLDSGKDKGGYRVATRFKGVNIEMKKDELDALGKEYGIVPTTLIGG